MKTIQEMLQELSQCIVTVSGEFRFRTNWNGGKVPQPDLDTFDPNVPFCIENVGDVPASVQYNTKNTNIRISKDYKTWNDYTSGTEIELNPKDRVYIKSDYVKDTGGDPRFVFNGNGAQLRARGNIASLIYGTNDAYVNKYTSTKDYCYGSMFRNCKSLTQAPELPATQLTEYCYSRMFQDCTSLTQAPELPATTLVDYCYYFMFNCCTSLTQAPELPATTLVDGCYIAMFMYCKSLVQAPELPATTLNFFGCYYSMFDGCARLNCVKCLATDASGDSCLYRWLANVASKGTFECDNKKYSKLDSPSGIPKGWTITEINPDPPTPPEPEKPDLDTFDPNVPFCIENVGDVPVEIGLYNYDKKNTAIVRTNCKISYDLKTWSDYTIVLTANTNSVDINKITLSNKGDRVYIKADKNKIDTTDLMASDIPSTRIKVINQSSETKIRARGNIASLNKGTNDAYKTNYLMMSTNDNLCYHSMFYDCMALTQAPELPATKLLSWCYSHMFYGCTLLEVAPSLPSTTLANYCYDYMFRGCTSLTQAPKLPATTLTNSCYNYMFDLCTSLTQAPELPASTLIKYCYNGMFRSCKKLNYVKCLATNITATDCVEYWLENVAKPGDFYTPASTDWTFGASGIPYGWTRHDIT